jgi:hypothetical protein
MTQGEMNVAFSGLKNSGKQRMALAESRKEEISSIVQKFNGTVKSKDMDAEVIFYRFDKFNEKAITILYVKFGLRENFVQEEFNDNDRVLFIKKLRSIFGESNITLDYWKIFLEGKFNSLKKLLKNDQGFQQAQKITQKDIRRMDSVAKLSDVDQSARSKQFDFGLAKKIEVQTAMALVEINDNKFARKVFNEETSDGRSNGMMFSEFHTAL